MAEFNYEDPEEIIQVDFNSGDSTEDEDQIIDVGVSEEEVAQDQKQPILPKKKKKKKSLASLAVAKKKVVDFLSKPIETDMSVLGGPVIKDRSFKTAGQSPEYKKQQADIIAVNKKQVHQILL